MTSVHHHAFSHSSSSSPSSNLPLPLSFLCPSSSSPLPAPFLLLFYPSSPFLPLLLFSIFLNVHDVILPAFSSSRGHFSVKLSHCQHVTVHPFLPGGLSATCHLLLRGPQGSAAGSSDAEYGLFTLRLSLLTVSTWPLMALNHFPYLSNQELYLSLFSLLLTTADWAVDKEEIICLSVLEA